MQGTITQKTGENLIHQDSQIPLPTAPHDSLPSLIALKLQNCNNKKIILKCNNPDCPICQEEKYFAVNYHCKLRLCPYCSKIRSVKWFHFFKDKLRFQYPKHVILTLRHGYDLAERLNLIIRAFRNLRKQEITDKKTHKKKKRFPLYRGIYGIEITKSKSIKGAWGVHMHILTNAYWFNIQELRKSWVKLTGGSHDVDVKHFDSVEGGLLEVTKGELKDSKGRPKNFTDQEKSYIEQIIKGRRLIGSWGLDYIYSHLEESEETTAPNFYCPVCHSRLYYCETIDRQEAFDRFFDKELIFYDSSQPKPDLAAN